MKQVSIIVPVWNEETNITPLVERIHNAFKEKNAYEIIFVDDNSTDQTQKNIKLLSEKYPITLEIKKGRRGKAFSLYQGLQKATSEYIAIIDADLQYPPEVIPDMILLLNDSADIVVANRVEQHTAKIRQFISKSFRSLFGKLLFGLNHDVQAGLKVFKRSVFQSLSYIPTSGWTFDLEFLHRATQAGCVIENFDITFAKRKNGKSKVSFLKTSLEIGLNALSVRTKQLKPVHFLPITGQLMKGAGVGFKRRKYITHTTLHHSQSAITTFIGKQRLLIGFFLLLTVVGLCTKPLLTLQTLIGTLSFVYFADVIFNFFLIMKSLHFPQEITSTVEELISLTDKGLPMYSILCPLYKEVHVIPQFLEAISKLEYPKEKLDVMLLLEEDDKESISKVSLMKLPPYVRTVVVPHSMPKTKPKACNYGLSLAKGEYLVIYDAEDMPDPLQLKKAYLAFHKAGLGVVCLQAKLNYYNPHQNLLTRFFTAEYSLWFDVTLTGLQAANTAIPLGGTSNHFRTADLKTLEGWDPFNVTEDADLGIRLFKRGFQTAIIDSVTLEEANSNVFNWVRQRSRWIKGYMQTYLVHTRQAFGMKNKNLWHSFIFHLNIGGKIAFILINPLLWLATISYFVLYKFVGPTIEILYPTYIFYMAAFSLVVGNFLFLYYYMIGCAKRDQWELIKYIYFVPFYWLLISWSGFVAFYQLLFKPHYWEKTIHGLHLNKKVIAEIIIQTQEKGSSLPFPARFRQALSKLIAQKKTYITGASLVVAGILGNVLNFAFNIFFGRVQNFEDFGLLSLISGLLYISTIPLNALSTTVTYRSGFLDTRHGKQTSYHFWKFVRRKTLLIGIVTSFIWLLLSPLLMKYFATDELLPFIIFSVIWFSGFTIAVDKGYLSGKLLFFALGITVFVEPFSKIFFATLLVISHHLSYAYLSIVLPSFVVFLTAWYFAVNTKPKEKNEEHPKELFKFPFKFYIASLLAGLSSVSFLSLDVILAKHFLTPTQAGEYAIVSLTGKVVYYLGGMVTQFLLPIVARQEGEKKNSLITLYYTLLFTGLFTGLGTVIFGLFGSITTPLIFGQKSFVIIPYVTAFTLAMMFFTLSKIFVSYYLVKKIYSFSFIAFILSIFQFILISINHQNILSIVTAMFITGFSSFILMLLGHILIKEIKTIESNFIDFLNLFSKKSFPQQMEKNKSLRILIFNWRDTKHQWAGGAEMYIQQLAKSWVRDGNIVTVFCGSDRKHLREEIIEGVHIIRHGGFYTVYLWAFIYYTLKFRGKYDVIIDSENGIPFFTPIYARKPIFLLIHHVHQEVFREHLLFPFSLLAQCIESKFMPFFYRKTNIITVSESSKKEIVKLGLGTDESITVIHPGVNLSDFRKSKKTSYPSILYLGRLKPYKNIDVAIKAFTKVVKDFPSAKFTIAGFGESQKTLMQLVKKLNLSTNVIFTGTISEKVKRKLLSESWIMVQPSMIEGWGITVIEANASGTPVIASNVNGLKDSVIHNQTGILVNPKNVNEFAEAMNDLLTDANTRKHISLQAFEWANKFSWDKSSINFYGLLQSQITALKIPFVSINLAKSNRIKINL